MKNDKKLHDLTPEEIEEFILVARSWVRQAVEADAVMELPLDTMREMFEIEIGTAEECGGWFLDEPAFLAMLRKAQPKHDVEELMEHNDGSPRRP